MKSDKYQSFKLGLSYTHQSIQGCLLQPVSEAYTLFSNSFNFSTTVKFNYFCSKDISFEGIRQKSNHPAQSSKPALTSFVPFSVDD
jgi:hypothetical protein